MKITFFLNMMGVYSQHWYEENNIPFTEGTRYNSILDKEITFKQYETEYCCGRIDIHGVSDELYGLSYGVEVMEAESWCLLGEYLSKLTLGQLPTKEELMIMFEEETNHKIKCFYRD